MGEAKALETIFTGKNRCESLLNWSKELFYSENLRSLVPTVVNESYRQ